MSHRVGPKGQVVIPKELRERLNIQPGDQVDFQIDNAGLRLERVNDWRALKGRFKGRGLTEELRKDRQRERARDV